MRTVILLFLIPLFALSGDRELTDLVRQQVQPLLAKGQLVGAVTLVAREGEVVDLQAHGLADREQGHAMTTSQIFRIHSCTKSITSAAALMLYEEGKYGFSDLIEQWIPAFDGSGIQVGQLFTHSSGVGYNRPSALKAGKLEAVVNDLANGKRPFKPGEGWLYGTSIDVLGRLVEIWSGDDYADFLQTRIFQPLGMQDTAFFVPPEKRSRLATLYVKRKGRKELEATAAWNEKGELIPQERPLFCGPGGGLFSTVSDYARFLMMIQNDGEWAGRRYLKRETVALMRSDQLAESAGWVRFGSQVRDGFRYGYGFNVVTQKSEWDPDARVGEHGWGGKASVHYWLHPKAKLVVVTMEQTLPYNKNLERVLKGPIYRYFDGKVNAPAESAGP
jgi:CubicO group peptidase (beta-lactamase class C family)